MGELFTFSRSWNGQNNFNWWYNIIDIFCFLYIHESLLFTSQEHSSWSQTSWILIFSCFSFSVFLGIGSISFIFKNETYPRGWIFPFKILSSHEDCKTDRYYISIDTETQVVKTETVLATVVCAWSLVLLFFESGNCGVGVSRGSWKFLWAEIAECSCDSDCFFHLGYVKELFEGNENEKWRTFSF